PGQAAEPGQGGGHEGEGEVDGRGLVGVEQNGVQGQRHGQRPEGRRQHPGQPAEGGRVDAGHPGPFGVGGGGPQGQAGAGAAGEGGQGGDGGGGHQQGGDLAAGHREVGEGEIDAAPSDGGGLGPRAPDGVADRRQERR